MLSNLSLLLLQGQLVIKNRVIKTQTNFETKQRIAYI